MRDCMVSLWRGYKTVRLLGRGARSKISQVRRCRTGEVFAFKRVVRMPDSDGRFLRQAVNEHSVAAGLNRGRGLL